MNQYCRFTYSYTQKLFHQWMVKTHQVIVQSEGLVWLVGWWKYSQVYLYNLLNESSPSAVPNVKWDWVGGGLESIA